MRSTIHFVQGDVRDRDVVDELSKGVDTVFHLAAESAVMPTVPASAKLGPTFARFRYAYESDLGPTGPAVAGEVEDYQVTVLPSVPIAPLIAPPGGAAGQQRAVGGPIYERKRVGEKGLEPLTSRM